MSNAQVTEDGPLTDDIPGLPPVSERTWFVTIEATNTGSRNSGPDRRGRAAAINACKRAYEREHGCTLALFDKSYSETHGFLHASYFRYTRTGGAPWPSS